MSVTASNVLAGSNNYLTPPQDVQFSVDEMLTAGVISGFAVTAQGTPNTTVAVASGISIIQATPTGESSRKFRTTLSASYNVTIAANSSGSTKYDKVYVTLPAAALHTPAANGDFTEALTILTERHNAAGEALTATNAIEIAEITVSNGFSSIVSGNISDTRSFASFDRLGHKYLEANFTTATSGSYVDVSVGGSPLAVTINVATPRPIRITAFAVNIQSSSASATDLSWAIFEGATQIAESTSTKTTASQAMPCFVTGIVIPTVGAHTYKVSAKQSTAGTLTVPSAATYRMLLITEYV